jgi:hypothetical protein
LGVGGQRFWANFPNGDQGVNDDHGFRWRGRMGGVGGVLEERVREGIKGITREMWGLFHGCEFYFSGVRAAERPL